MSPSSPAQPDARTQKILIMAIAGAVAMMGASASVVFLTLSSQDKEPTHPTPVKALDQEPEDAYDAPATAPNPTPLDGTAQGYGRPEPLFTSQGEILPDAPEPLAPVYAPTDDGRVEVRSLNGGPTSGTLPGRLGNPYARVKLVVFNDFECPYCSKLEASLSALEERYPSQIEIHFRDFPLTMHKQARGAHMAARCAHDQGRFWAMHDLLFANQRALEAEHLLGYAAELGLQTASFERCLTEAHHAVAIDADIAAGQAAGVKGTPATFVNDTLISGARPVEDFVAAIEAAL